MIKEKPITIKDIEMFPLCPPGRQKLGKQLNKKGTFPLDKHLRLLDRIIRSY